MASAESAFIDLESVGRFLLAEDYLLTALELLQEAKLRGLQAHHLQEVDAFFHSERFASLLKQIDEKGDLPASLSSSRSICRVRGCC